MGWETIISIIDEGPAVIREQLYRDAALKIEDERARWEALANRTLLQVKEANRQVDESLALTERVIATVKPAAGVMLLELFVIIILVIRLVTI